MSSGVLTVFSRGCLVSDHGDMRFYDNDGAYLEALSSRFAEVRIVAPLITEADAEFAWARGYTHRFMSPNIKLFPYTFRRGLLALFSSQKTLLRALRGSDVLFIMGPSGPAYVAALLFGHANATVFYSGIPWESGRGLAGVLKRLLERLAVRNVRHVLCTGPKLREFYEGICSGARVDETYPLIGRAFAQRAGKIELRAKPPGARFRILSVGSLLDRKDHVTTLKGVIRLRDELLVDATLDIVGAGDVDEWIHKNRALLTQLGGHAKVHGQIRDMERLVSMFSESDVLVVSSVLEGFPRVIYEAMLMGVPVVCTPLPSVTASLRDRVEICLFPFRDAITLGDILFELYASPHLRHELSANAATWVSKNVEFSADTQVWNILDGLMSESA